MHAIRWIGIAAFALAATIARVSGDVELERIVAYGFFWTCIASLVVYALLAPRAYVALWDAVKRAHRWDFSGFKRSR